MTYRLVSDIKNNSGIIEVGYGYEGVLTDLESNKLLTKFSELLKSVL